MIGKRFHRLSIEIDAARSSRGIPCVPVVFVEEFQPHHRLHRREAGNLPAVTQSRNQYRYCRRAPGDQGCEHRRWLAGFGFEQQRPGLAYAIGQEGTATGIGAISDIWVVDHSQRFDHRGIVASRRVFRGR